MKISDMSPDQIDQAKACKTPEELVQYMRDEGVELSDEQGNIADETLEQVAGGAGTVVSARFADSMSANRPPCPQCGSSNTRPYAGFAGLRFACDDCSAAFD